MDVLELDLPKSKEMNVTQNEKRVEERQTSRLSRVDAALEMRQSDKLTLKNALVDKK